MKNKHLATYPINYKSYSEKSSVEKIFDDKSRDSYFRSMEEAQKNLLNLLKK